MNRSFKIVNLKNKLTPVIIISGHATVQIAVTIRLGAYDLLKAF